MNASPFLRPALAGCEVYVPGEQPPAGEHWIKLNTNENPYPPAPGVANVLRAWAADPATLRKYPDPLCTRLRQVASQVYGLPADWILAGNGSDELLAMILRACVDPGDVVTYPVPTYVLYRTLADLAGATRREVPLTATYEIPDDCLEQLGRVTFLAHPNSPTGREVPRALVCAACERRTGVVVVDEAYADFADSRHVDLVPRYDNLVVLRTCSKSYALASARLGLAFCGRALMQGLLKVKDSYNVNGLTQVIGSAALEDQATMRAQADRVRATRARLTAGLEALGLRVIPSSANFVFAECGSAVEAQTVFEGLRARRILVRYFREPRLDHGLRITVGSDDEVDALLAAMRELAQD